MVSGTSLLGGSGSVIKSSSSSSSPSSSAHCASSGPSSYSSGSGSFVISITAAWSSIVTKDWDVFPSRGWLPLLPVRECGLRFPGELCRKHNTLLSRASKSDSVYIGLLACPSDFDAAMNCRACLFVISNVGEPDALLHLLTTYRGCTSNHLRSINGRLPSTGLMSIPPNASFRTTGWLSC